MKSQKIGFTVRLEQPGIQNHGYGALRIWLSPSWARWSVYGVDIEWQSNRETPWEFYGGKVKIDGCEHMQKLGEFVGMLKKLFPNHKDDGAPFCFTESAEAVLEILKASKAAVQVVYDQRQSEYLPLGEVKPSEFDAWRDDFNRAGYTSCVTGCLAPDEDEARRLLTIEYAKEARTGTYRERMDQWLKAGRPVMRLRRDAPEIMTAEQALAWIQTEKAKAKEQAQETVAA